MYGPNLRKKKFKDQTFEDFNIFIYLFICSYFDTLSRAGTSEYLLLYFKLKLVLLSMVNSCQTKRVNSFFRLSQYVPTKENNFRTFSSMLTYKTHYNNVRVQTLARR